MDSGGWLAAPLVPPFVLLFYNTVNTQQGSELPQISGLTLDASNQSSLGFNFKCTPKKKEERKIKTREEGLEESKC